MAAIIHELRLLLNHFYIKNKHTYIHKLYVYTHVFGTPIHKYCTVQAYYVWRNYVGLAESADVTTGLFSFNETR